jgi:hypothetical protein
MVVVYGTRFYGKVAACGSSFIATRFFHIYYLPLIPVGSHLVIEENGDGSYRGLPHPFSLKSMFAGYMRVWGPFATVGALIALGAGFSEPSEDMVDLALGVVPPAFGLLLALAATVLAWAVIGRLGQEDKQKRAVWALHTGIFADPGDLGDARFSIREALLQTIAERAHGLGAQGYRLPPDPRAAWAQIALDPSQTDEGILTAAYTLARVEGSAAAEPAKSELARVEGSLWQRIRALNPPYLQGV